MSNRSDSASARDLRGAEPHPVTIAARAQGAHPALELVKDVCAPVAAELGFLALLAGLVAGRAVLVLNTPGPSYATLTCVHVEEQQTRDDRKDAVLVQAAMLASGSLEVAGLRRLVGRPGAARRYFALEAARAALACRDQLPRRLVSILEPCWSQPLPLTPQASLERALRGGDVPDIPAHLGVVRPGDVLVRPKHKGKRGDRLPDDQDAALADDDDEESGGERSRILERLSSPVSMPSLFSSLLSRASSSERQETGEQPDDGAAETAVRRRATSVRKGFVARANELVASALGGEEPRPGVLVYPEWNVHAAGYRKDWCHVEEFFVDPWTGADAESSRDVLLVRRLARVGLGLRRHDRMDAGDGLDLDALVDHAVGSRTGNAQHDHVYSQRRHTRRDLGVTVLLDASGSAAEETVAGTTRMVEQARTAARLVAALTELDASTELVAFNGQGRSAVRMHVVKRVDEPWEGLQRQRLAALEPAGFTRLGAAVRHVGSRLVSRSSDTSRILVVISDGLPYDDGYEGRYAEADSCKALAEVRAAGVAVVCLTTSSDRGVGDLARVFGSADHVLLESPAELATRLAPVLQESLARSRAVTRQDVLQANTPRSAHR